MSDEEQKQEAERRRRFGIPQGIDPRNFDPRNLDPRNFDPRNFDPRKMMDPDKVMRAQAIARAEAQAATTVAIATIVSLVTSAFSFVAALAWNTAIQDLLANSVGNTFLGIQLNDTEKAFIYAIGVTLVAIVVTLLVNRIAGNIAKRSASAAAANS